MYHVMQYLITPSTGPTTDLILKATWSKVFKPWNANIYLRKFKYMTKW